MGYTVPPVWLLRDLAPTPPRRHRHEHCWCGAQFHHLPWRVR
jgi:hypothetical protein